MAEATRIKDLRHENIVELLGVCFTTEPKLIIMEFMHLGDLKTFFATIKNSKIAFEESFDCICYFHRPFRFGIFDIFAN